VVAKITEAAIVIAVLFVIAANSTRANTYAWDCQFRSTIAFWAALYKTQYPNDLEADAVIGIKAALRDLAQTDGKDLAQDKQAILVAVVHIAFLGVRAGKEPQEIAADYMKMCVAMNRDHG
jgi:hypothetical protein